MPLKNARDALGMFWQYGNRKKYHYQTELGNKRSKTKAIKQMVAVKISEGRIKPKSNRK